SPWGRGLACDACVHLLSAYSIAARSRGEISLQIEPTIAPRILVGVSPATVAIARSATIGIVFILGLFFGVRRLVAAFHSGPAYQSHSDRFRPGASFVPAGHRF